MFKNHPKGLLAASLANMGERFGFYTMMAILSLFLMTKFGLNETNAGIIYSVFYASIYLLALVGGLIADKTRNYKGIILLGLLLMTLGYVIISIPTATPVPSDKFGILLALSCFGLLIIAFGNGMFKGNLQALVGQMYDNPQYSKMRDSGFQLFYMFINVGAIFAPFLAVGVRNWWVEKNGYCIMPTFLRLLTNIWEIPLHLKVRPGYKVWHRKPDLPVPTLRLSVVDIRTCSLPGSITLLRWLSWRCLFHW